jgi:antitoxin component YwqK of YwqJK toxin-antitoxin module
MIPYDKEGTQDGIEVCYADETKTTVTREITWKRGKREGAAKCWQNGKLRLEAEYRDDALTGILILHDYDAAGTRVHLLENGEEKGMVFRMSDGKVTRVDYCVINGVPTFEHVLSCPVQDYGRYSAPLAAWKKREQERNHTLAKESARLLNGPQQAKYPSGKLRAKWTNRDGQIHGKFTGFFETGKVKLDCEYVNGKFHGTCQEYDPSEKLLRRETWVSGELTKLERFYHNGKPQETVTRVTPDRHCLDTYYDSGTKSQSLCFKDKSKGLSREAFPWRWRPLDGPFQSWDPRGDLSETGQFMNGKPVGKWEYFTGNRLERESFYEQGNLVRTIDHGPGFRTLREYFADGSLKLEKRLEGQSGSKEKLI